MASQIARLQRERRLNQQAATLRAIAIVIAVAGIVIWTLAAAFKEASVVTFGQTLAGVAVVIFVSTFSWKKRRLNQLE